VNQYLDKKCVRVFEGDRHMTQAVLEEKYDHMFFTGGSYVGRMVAESAAKHLTPTVLELGGKSPCIVDKSADLTVAAKRVSWGAFLNCGQTCIRPDYLMVHADVADEFIKRLRESTKDMFGPDPQQSDYFGRLINERAWQRVNELIQKCGVKPEMIYGGKASQRDKYIEPTIIDFGSNEDAFRSSPVMQEEIFGPILPVLRYRSIDSVIRWIRAHDKPLSLYCFTTDSRVRERILTETSSGSCDINDCMMHMTNENLPFGGIGKSGMGAYHGKQSFGTFSHRKSVLVKTNYLDLPQRYPPYSPFAVQLLTMIQTPRPKQHLQMVKFIFLFLILFGGYLARGAIKKLLMPYLIKLFVFAYTRMNAK